MSKQLSIHKVMRFYRRRVLPFEWLVEIYNAKHRRAGEKLLKVGNAKMIERQARLKLLAAIQEASCSTMK